MVNVARADRDLDAAVELDRVTSEERDVDRPAAARAGDGNDAEVAHDAPPSDRAIRSHVTPQTPQRPHGQDFDGQCGLRCFAHAGHDAVGPHTR